MHASIHTDTHTHLVLALKRHRSVFENNKINTRAKASRSLFR